jgi:hypothetical protein
MSVPTTMRLPALAEAIRTEHDAFERDARSAIAHAVRAGELLIEAKANVVHGQWLPWLAENFPAGERTARNYMRLAANRQRVSDMGSVRAGLAELAAPHDPPPEPSPENVAEDVGRSDFDTGTAGEAMRTTPDPSEYETDQLAFRVASIAHEGNRRATNFGARTMGDPSKTIRSLDAAMRDIGEWRAALTERVNEEALQ